MGAFLFFWGGADFLIFLALHGSTNGTVYYLLLPLRDKNVYTLNFCADTPICGCLYTSYHVSAYRSKSIPSGTAFAPVPTVILARYLPSFCFAILLPLSSFCFIIGARDFSFLAPFLCSARLQPCGILMAA